MLPQPPRAAIVHGGFISLVNVNINGEMHNGFAASQRTEISSLRALLGTKYRDMEFIWAIIAPAAGACVNARFGGMSTRKQIKYRSRARDDGG